MRKIPPELAASLAAPLTSLAYLWRLQRMDGVALGFTTHDRPIEYEGLIYDPTPGMSPAAAVQSNGLEAGGTDIAGALSSEFITASDLHVGRYDGAKAELRLIDWQKPQGGALLLLSGSVGEVTVEDGSFEAELITAEQALSRVPVELTSPECRANFGDERCQVDLSRRRIAATVEAVIDGEHIRINHTDAAGAFSYGRLRVVSGALAGTDLEIARSSGDELTLGDFAPGLAAGDKLQLTEGCDRRWVTCRERFANGANFRGEPHVPGRDSVLRYPSL